MDANIRKLWVKTLRSDKYKQGQKCLHNPIEGTHCCLGVLTELAVDAGVVSKGEIDFEDHQQYGNENESSVLPKVVAKWADLDSGPVVVTPYGTQEIALLNDRGGHDFSELADLIEEQL